MKFKIRSFTSVLQSAVLSLGLFFAASAQAQDPTYIVRLGSPTMNDTMHHWMELFKKGVEARTEGKMRIDLFPAGQLGAVPRQVEAVQFGSQEMFTIASEFLVGLDKRYMVPSAPLLFDNIQHASRAVQDPEFSEKFLKIGDDKGLRGISMFCSDRTTYTFTKPINSYKDMAGRKIRIFASDMERETINRYGATGVGMSLGEVLPALQQGVVDGARTTISVFVPFKFYDSAKYLLKTEESMVCPIQIVNRQWFESLPENIQTVILEEAASAARATSVFAVGFAEGNYESWVKNGGEIVELTPEQRTELTALLKDVGEVVTSKEPGMAEMYRQLKEVAERTR